MSLFHALSHSGDQITVDLYHGQYYIDSLYGGSDGEYATGSNAATLNLAAGDTVFLKSRTSTHSYYAEPDQVYYTFSGYKLKLAEDLNIGNQGVFKWLTFNNKIQYILVCILVLYCS